MAAVSDRLDSGIGTSSSSIVSTATKTEAVSVVEVDDEHHEFKLLEDTLGQLLLNPKIADKKVAVVSVAGAFRKGKSFLLNFFLRYLRWLELPASERSDDWLEAASVLEGFSWRGGSERETSGMLLWPEPFLLKDKDGEEVAVILMDTQGAFDQQSTVRDCATIFALSTMISSVQIYNLSQNIQEDDLQHLQLFTEYGRLASEQPNAGRPFQSLVFIVRDWQFPYEAEYGFQGGQRILDRRLELSDRQHNELQQLRRHIRSCFDSLSCFLLPHPGLRVATNPEFRGQLSEIEAEFKQQLRTLVPRIFDPNHLVVKQINAQKVTSRELLEFFKVYLRTFQGDTLPEPRSMLEATAEANNLAAVSHSRAHYVKKMEEECGGDAPYISTSELAERHERFRLESINEFRKYRKMGSTEFSLVFLEKLEAEIAESYEAYQKFNAGKNLFKSMRTPAVLISTVVILYVVRTFLDIVGINVLDWLLVSATTTCFVALFIWGYARYSGAMRDLSSAIDAAIEFVWHNFISPHADRFVPLQGDYGSFNSTTVAAASSVIASAAGGAGAAAGLRKRN